MDHWKEPLNLEIGDTIIWRGDEMRIRNDTEGMMLISPGMRGEVITRSEDPSCLRDSEGSHHPGVSKMIQ